MNRHLKNCLILFGIFLSSASLYAQQKVSGRILDAKDGEPLIGATVLEKGTSNGVITDIDGNFSITVTGDATLEVSYVGYATQEIPVNNRSVIDVQMDLDLAQLEEIVVVGYGSQKKSNVVGSVASVDVKDATAIPTTNVSEMLRGRAAGVQVNLGDARPGGFSNIVIRGQVSVSGSSNPLIIVDGLIFETLNDVSPDDIASIEILKDASATAIYGSRAANGVILITTKKGQLGTPVINYHGYYTTQSLTRNFNLYSGSQYVDLRREANRDRSTGEYVFDELIFDEFERDAIENSNYVNWQDLVLKNSQIQSHSLSLSSGTENTKIYSSLTYFTQDGIIPTSGFDRATFKMNLNQKINEKLTLRGIVNYQNTQFRRETGGLDIITLSPLAQPFDADGSLQKLYLGSSNPNDINPLWNQRESDDLEKINLTDLNLSFDYQLLPNLTYTLKTFIRNRNNNRTLYQSSQHEGGDQGVGGLGILWNSLYRQSLVENIVNYTPELGSDHALDFTAVQAFDEQRNEYSQLNKSGFTNDALGANGPASNLLAAPRDVTQRRLLSFMGRVRYGYLDRYLLEVTARADGASVFAENNKWGFFPAASFAWKAHEESFLKDVSAIDEMKFRVSYGLTGNQGISSNLSLGIADDLPYIVGGVTVPGASASSILPNPNLKWETTATLNAGVDFELLNNFVSGTFEVYKKNTTDLLLNRRIAGTSGFTQTTFNVGEIQNVGFESSVIVNLITKPDFQWSVGTTFSSNRNEILSLTGETGADGEPLDIIDIYGRRLSVGQSINNIWLPKYDGIWQVGEDPSGSGTPLAQPGDIRVIDQNEDGKIDDEDNVFVKTDPDWYGSINTTVNYKNFEIFADFFIVKGATLLNPVLSDGELWKGRNNGIRTKYYTPEAPSTEYPRPKASEHDHLFSFAIRDASYFRLRTLTVGYNVPSAIISKAKISNAKVYVTGTNLLTFTKFPSYSPEQNPTTNSGSTTFPETRNLTVGVKIGF